MKFDGKVALVSGASSGIGKEAAVQFAKHGAKVVCAARRKEEGEATVKKIKDAGGEAIFVQTDVADEKQIERLVQETLKKYGRLDYAFNNAGVEGKVGIMVQDQSAEEFDTVFDINVKGVLLSMKHEIRAMSKNGGGSIVNNSSIAGMVGMPGASVYIASKHAVNGLTKAAAVEYAKQKIRINAVCPAAIKTDMFDRFFDGKAELEKTMEQAHPLGRIGEAKEVAEAVLFLCSDGASFITGQCLPVDGGYTAQ
jgi:NAD(P)-dependent dehydrogenase (short-subunit alcohol dehydrogenase family)